MIEVADKFNMVDMGGIDIVKSQGIAVDGLFTRLLNSIQQCRYSLLYNWYFAEIAIVPTPVELVFDGEKVTINELISITPDDVVRIASIETPAVISPLSVGENGIYIAPIGVDGFSPVNVNVPQPLPVIQSLSVTENGMYSPPIGVDGYAPITVNVPVVHVQEIPYDVEYEQGSASGQSGSYNSNKVSSTTRIRPVDIVSTEDYTGQQSLVMFNQGYDIAFQWYDSNGMWVTGTDWRTSNFVVTISNPNLVILIRHDDNSAITPDEFDDVELRIILTSSL